MHKLLRYLSAFINQVIEIVSKIRSALFSNKPLQGSKKFFKISVKSLAFAIRNAKRFLHAIISTIAKTRRRLRLRRMFENAQKL